MILKRHPDNPIIRPDPRVPREKVAAFNPNVVYDGKQFHLLYRALAEPKPFRGAQVPLSVVGHAVGTDGIHFEKQDPLVLPERDWEIFGCEDPRVTKIDGAYYIFYTAISAWPPGPSSIRAGVAVSDDMRTIREKHLVTPFNAKAMSLFPERVNGKLTAILTANTDRPPVRIAIAQFNDIKELWSEEYWREWYEHLIDHVVTVRRMTCDHVEVGAPPIALPEGWLLIYCYIRNYYCGSPQFCIEALLLDRENPQRVIGRVKEPLLIPAEPYEREGIVRDIVFPSGANVIGKDLYVYYGGADTVSCVATAKLEAIMDRMRPYDVVKLKRYDRNPILAPRTEHFWESRAVFNPAAIYEDGKVHLVYRAMGGDNTSVLGYAMSENGFLIEERLIQPIYQPRADFEDKKHPGNSGCEDPRITKIGDRFYMCYTAYDGVHSPRVALTSIAVRDFLAHQWNWDMPQLISPPNVDDKDACLFPEKINGKYVFLHRIPPNIVVDYTDDLTFGEGKKWLATRGLIKPRKDMWDNEKIGICGPPIKTDVGWLLLYHGISHGDFHYRVGAMLLGLDDPSHVISRTEYPILEPETDYEKSGLVSNVVFPCGAVIVGEKLFVYYGGGDMVVGVATVNFEKLMSAVLAGAHHVTGFALLERGK